jgi:twitching motility protein PilT
MSGIDQLLLLVKSQASTELRLAVDQEPQMFANGQRKRLSLAATGEYDLRHLVTPLLSAERNNELRERGHLSIDHYVPDAGNFRVTFTEKGPGTLKVLFQLSPNACEPVVPSNHTPSPDSFDTSERHAVSHHATSTTTATSYNAENRDILESASPEISCSNELLELIALAVERRASDIHLADHEPTYLRVDGRLSRLSPEPPRSVEDWFTLPESLRSKLNSGHSVDIGFDVSPRERLRISLFRTSQGLSAAIRLLPARAPTLSALNLPLPIDDLVALPHGLVLVCGATGSGKSTTLAALAQHALETRSIVLTTLEDPIEYTLTPSAHSVVRRRQIGRDVVSFRCGLRDALRSDPDVVLVGELRDSETIQLALTAAETGHLVLASLHSGNAASTIERIVDAYPNERRTQIRVQLADALRAVIAQQLVPRQQGTGRLPALELLRVTHAAANIIREGRTAQLGTLLQSGKREGMLSMDRCLADYVHAGVLSLEQAQAAAHNLESLSTFLGK